jgi:polyphosphate kinase 2 (PPK2 family)
MAMPEAVVARRGFKLAQLDLDRALFDAKTYQLRLEAAQIAIARDRGEFPRFGDGRGIVVFEGWDAGGKDGAIRASRQHPTRTGSASG